MVLYDPDTDRVLNPTSHCLNRRQQRPKPGDGDGDGNDRTQCITEELQQLHIAPNDKMCQTNISIPANLVLV